MLHMSKLHVELRPLQTELKESKSLASAASSQSVLFARLKPAQDLMARVKEMIIQKKRSGRKLGYSLYAFDAHQRGEMTDEEYESALAQVDKIHKEGTFFEDCSGNMLTTISAAEREAVLASPAEVDLSDKDQVIRRLCKNIKDGKYRNIVVAAGAGMSVAAGIPDFRSKGGLYERMREEHGMTTPEQLFQIDYFKEHPEPFCRQASAMCPGLFAPTASHLFLKLLVEEGIVRRIFTQNIDTLEAQVHT